MEKTCEFCEYESVGMDMYPLSQGDSNYDFCPNCGCRMKGADDEAD